MITVTEKDYQKILDAARGSASILEIEHCISKNFRSAHHTTCRNIVNSVVLNLFLNDKDELSPNSAEPIIKYIRRNNTAFYTSVESMFKPIEEKFMTYARKVTDDADALYAKMRVANFIVYIISADMIDSGKFSRDEILTRTYSYSELIKLRRL